MKRQIRFAVTSTLGLLLVLVASQAFGDVINYKVRLNPMPSGELKALLFWGQPCFGNPHDGCMNFEVDTMGAIFFQVQGNPNSVNCDYPPGQPATHVITKIELTDKPKGGSPDSKKGDFEGPLAETWLKQYAFPAVNQETGVLYEVSKDDGLARIALVNQNSHPTETDPKRFWYKVTVTGCAEGGTWVTDPRGDNNGID